MTPKARLAKALAVVDEVEDIVGVVDALSAEKVIAVVPVAQLLAVDAL